MGLYLRTVPSSSQTRSFFLFIEKSPNNSEVTFGQHHPSWLLAPSSPVFSCLYIASHNLPPWTPPHLHWRCQTLVSTLIKWDSVSVPSQATGNSGNKWNCLRVCVECGPARARVVARLCECALRACACVSAHERGHIKLQRSTCVSACCDAVTSRYCLRDHAVEGGEEEEREGCDGRQMNTSSRTKTVCATTQLPWHLWFTKSLFLVMDILCLARKRTWAVAKNLNPYTVGFTGYSIGYVFSIILVVKLEYAYWTPRRLVCVSFNSM